MHTLPAMLMEPLLEDLHGRLWSQAMAAREKVTSPFFAGHFIQSLNEMIALHTRRTVIRLEFRIPNTIWLVYIIDRGSRQPA